MKNVNYKLYKTHMVLPMNGEQTMLCTITYSLYASNKWNMKDWLTTSDVEKVTCKHCLKLVKHNPFVKRIISRHQELQLTE